MGPVDDIPVKPAREVGKGLGVKFLLKLLHPPESKTDLFVFTAVSQPFGQVKKLLP